MEKAKKMVKDAADAGVECIKFQMHVIEDEMAPIAKQVVPGHTKESIWEIIEGCALTKENHVELKKYCEELGIIYLCTPFSREASNRLNDMGIEAFKIGSGECNNYPLIKHIAGFRKPVILSTGMNNIESIKKATKILKKMKVPHALLHCTSLYPTPYEKVRLGALAEMKKEFPNVVIGLSDHSIGNYAGFAAVALGASIVEKHFTSDRNWPGPDIPLSITPDELSELIEGCNAIHKSLGGHKNILEEEHPTINFAYATVVSIKYIKKGERFTPDNLWVKRPGTGEILAEHYEKILGRKAAQDIASDVQLKREDIE
jgi:N-acetylneuraminate synthase